ncbi:MAG: DUF3892 domain-containing protein [Candidatus Aegiribacteria sp.]|nr:DUF3892 domain-containing protein [Candidatus Aegiribacteria sp.]
MKSEGLKMSKWADYGISRIRLDSDDNHIERVEICPNPSKKNDPINFFDVSRRTVILEFTKQITFVTITQENGEWHRGANVHAVPVDGGVYIRTDRNKIAEDNLGNLPKF